MHCIGVQDGGVLQLAADRHALADTPRYYPSVLLEPLNVWQPVEMLTYMSEIRTCSRTKLCGKSHQGPPGFDDSLRTRRCDALHSRCQLPG